jgi:mono/diheme cytochrome c family protein
VTAQPRKVNEGRSNMARGLFAFSVLALALFCNAGCRQKMADQPYYRPYEPTESFEDGRSNRPLERGVIHRGQHIEVDPLVTGLTREEWARAYALGTTPKLDLGEQAKPENREIAIGSPRFDPRVAGQPKVYVDEFPFEITKDDMKRGQDRFTIYCAVCHGPLGNGEGKIWERGYLRPTSFHTTPVAENEMVEFQNGAWFERELRTKPARGQIGFPRTDLPFGYLPLGFSRGYGIVWNIRIPLREAPVGYYFEVMTRGYAGMPSYSAQIPPADRWRIVAYIKALQMSQFADASKLNDEIKKRVEAGGKP